MQQKILHEGWHGFLKVAQRFERVERYHCSCSWTGLKEGKCLKRLMDSFAQILTRPFETLGRKRRLPRHLNKRVEFRESAEVHSKSCLHHRSLFTKRCRGGDSREGGGRCDWSEWRETPALASRRVKSDSQRRRNNFSLQQLVCLDSDRVDQHQ